MKNIFTKRITRTASIVGISGIALLLIGIATYASVPSFQNFVKSSLGIEKKNVSVPGDANNKTVTEENNASDTSQNTVTAEKPTENIATDNVVTTEKVPATTSAPKTKAPTAATTPAPTPPSPPTQVAFQVSSATASVSPTQGPSACVKYSTSFAFTFTGTITATAAGTVQYKWVRSNGGTPVDQTLVFSSADTKQVTMDWTTYSPGDAGSYWGQLVVSSPNSISSNKASFQRLFCPAF